jgi:hypothetical protein
MFYNMKSSFSWGHVLFRRHGLQCGESIYSEVIYVGARDRPATDVNIRTRRISLWL